MASYFEEMGWQPLGDGETPNHLLHLARLLRDYNMFEELGVNQKLAPPASKKVVDELPEETVDAEGKQCPVCLKIHDIGETVRKLPCLHCFHDTCIKPWLEKTNSCPLCRHELPTDDEDYEEYRKEKIRAKQREEEIETLHNSMFS
ncbi:e3 ubiquitin-protein ligase praja [Holotrichia oblita]|uniref:E3 ubiquitin-protein ligase praja n=2 Tax=Holotrichia oblita TaxID=644536 RepID=A0ACB9SVD9_HOLOL|nr:e3 ubiquitin-protein ligase praja [Holotrichia oblita]KAI4457560.1 e3 ubiquitin-protein ligase praja [Holotrichia oblita]